MIRVDDNVIKLAGYLLRRRRHRGRFGDLPGRHARRPAADTDSDPPPGDAAQPDARQERHRIGFIQTLTRPRNMPIPGLADGGVYYVLAGVDGSSFQLGTTPSSGAHYRLGTTYGGFDITGPNHFAVESVDLTSKGSGSQDLVIDITGTSSGTQQMVGIGGPSHLVSAPTGDRLTTASSSGSGGGIIDVGSSDATSSDHETTT